MFPPKFNSKALAMLIQQAFNDCCNLTAGSERNMLISFPFFLFVEVLEKLRNEGEIKRVIQNNALEDGRGRRKLDKVFIREKLESELKSS